MDRAYDEAIERIDDASADGTLLRGEVLARWQEFVGTGELLRSLETKVGWLRDRVVGWVRGKPMQAERVTVAVESGLETLILEHAETAAERAEASWRSVTAGQHLVEDSGRELGRASRDFRVRAERSVRDWQHGVLEMVRSEGADKRSTARFLAFGVNGLSVALMVVVFAHTAGVSGAEVGIAGGSAVVGQKLLEAVFGDQAVRRLADAARQDLNERVTALMDAERARFVTVLDDLGIEEGDVDRLREVSRRVDDLRLRRQGTRHDARHGELRVTALVEGAKRLVGRRSDVVDRIDGLDEAARSARGRLDDALVDEAAAVAERAGARLRLSGDHTVVALAGATGSGKSSTFNAVTGLELAAIGVRRPTTSWTMACAWGARRCPGAARLAGRPQAPPGDARQHARRAAARTAGSTGWCCSTCPTTTRPRSPTTSRSTGW